MSENKIRFWTMLLAVILGTIFARYISANWFENAKPIEVNINHHSWVECGGYTDATFGSGHDIFEDAEDLDEQN